MSASQGLKHIGTALAAMSARVTELPLSLLLGKLRLLLASQMQMQANVAAAATDRQAARDAARERTRRRGMIPDLGNAVFRATQSGLETGE